MSNKSWKPSFTILVVAILFITAFAVISFQLWKQVKNFNDKLNSTKDLKLQLQIVQNALLYNESNAKSYIISPSPQLENLLKEVPDLIRTEIKKLDTLLTTEPVDQLGIDSLSFYANKRIEFTSNVLKTRKEGGGNAALTFINASTERYYISKTRSLINYWKEKEDLEQQNDLTARKNTLTNFNLVLLSIFILMTLLGVVYVLQLLKNADQKNKEIDTAKYLQTILDNISEPVITTDADFKIQTWNKAAAKVYALDPVQSKETDIVTAVRSQFAEQERADIRNEMRKNGFWKGEVMHLNADGQEIVIQSLTSALVNKDGKLTGYVSANRDITEEKLAKDLLTKFAHELSTQVKEKTTQLTNVFERVSDAFVALDNNWKYTYVNKKAEQLFNKPDGYLIGKHIWTEFPEGIGQPFHLAYEKALNEQQYIYLEEYYPPYDRWFENHIYPSPTGLSIYFRDITDKKKAEIAFKESELKYRTLIEQASDAIFITDEKGSYIDVNTSGCELVGYTREELSSLSIEDLVVIDKDFIPFRFAELKTGKSVIQTRKLLKKDSSEILVEIHTKLLADGKMLGIARDLTERIKAEERLQKEKDLSDKIINSLPGIFYLADPSPRMLRWNKDFEMVSGYSAEELSKMVPITLFETEDQHKVRQSLEKIYKEGQATVEARLLTKSGETIPFYFTGVRIEFEGRMAMLGTGIDMSEQKKTEEELKETARFLKETQAIANLGTYVVDIKTGNWTGSELLYQILGIDQHFDKTFETGQLIIHPEWRKMMADYFAVEVITKKNKFDIEYKIIRPVDKEERWIHGIGDLKFNDKNEPIALVATIQDITRIKGIEDLLKKRNEELLIAKIFAEENEEKFKAYTQFLPIGVYTTNANGECVYANNKWLEIAGLTLEESLGKGWMNALYEDDKEFISFNWEKSVEANGNWTYEYRFINKEGKITWVEANAKPLYNKENHLTGYLGSNVDITERKKAEKEIRSSNERFELIGKATNDAIWEWNLETNEIWGNEEHQQLYGLSMTDPVPDNIEWEERLHIDDKERVIKTVAEALASEQKSFEIEYRLFSENRNWINIYGCTYIERNKEGKAIRLLGNMTDITELRQKEQHLKLLESVITNTNDAVMITEAEPFDAPGPKIVYVNAAFCKMTGYTESEVIGKTPRILQGPKTDWNELNRLKEAMKKWEPCEITTINYKKNGEEFWINFSISPVANEKGWFTHWISIDKDVTEHKNEEKQLKDSEARLRLSLKAANQGLYDVNVQTGEAIVNDQYALMLGYDPDTFVETNTFWLERVHPDDLAETSKAYLDYVQGRSNDYRIEFRKKTKDNNWKWILSIGKIVEHDAEGKPLRMLGTHTDITKRKQVEEALQNAEKRLRFLLTSTPAVIYSSQAMYPFGATFISENIKNQTGYQPEDFSNDPNFWSDHIHPEEKQKVLKNISQLFEKGHHLHEYRFRIKDGNYVWIQDEVILIFDEDGKPKETVGYWININERKKAEEALAESENRLRTIYNTEPECIKMLNSRGELLEMNPAGLAMIEADSIDQVKGKSIFNIIDKEYRKDFIRLTKDVFNNKSGKMLFSITGIKGTKRWLETNAVPMKDAAGNISALLGVTMDVTDKRKAEKELIENEEKYRTLVEQAVDAIALYDASGKVLDVNTGASILLGYTKEELIGMSLKEILTEEDISKNPIQYDVLQQGQSTVKERKMIRKDGMVVETEVRSQQLPDGRFLSVIRDLSERIKAEKDLSESYEAIRKLTSHIQNIREEERTNIAREIHDELGQQLTVLKMDVSWVNKKIVTTDDIIKQKVKGVLTMLDETVKTVRRISSELRPSLLDDLGLTAAMEWQLFEIKKRSALKINFTAPEQEIKLPDLIKTGLFRIFQESLTNVIRHADAKNLKVILEQKNHHLTLSIEDDGKGFDKGKIADKRTLGILGMKERTSMIGGTYEINGIPGKGTVVEVVIPMEGQS